MPTPQTGTFRLNVVSQSSLSGQWAKVGTEGTPVGDITSYVTGQGGDSATLAYTDEVFCDPDSFGFFVPGGQTFRAEFTPSTSIILNPGTVDEETLPISSLPSGFTITSASVVIRMRFNAAGSSNTYQFVHDGFTIGSASSADSGVSYETVTSTIVGTPGPAYNLSIYNGTAGVQVVTVDNQNAITGCGTIPYCDVDYDMDHVYKTGSYELANFQWYLEREDEEHDGIKFKRDKLTQVDEGEDPPEGAIPIGAENEVPTFEWWEYDDGDILLYLYQPTSPGTNWVIVGSPTDYGWWKSFEEFQGGALLVVNANPKKPRTFEEITDFSDFMGGFPGCGTVYNYKLVYAGRDYDDEPVIRIFDGLSDRELCRIPPVSGTDAVAIISIATVNGSIYVTTLDSGDGTVDSGGSSFAGRVFQLDVPSASLTLIGSQFTGGQLPYALAWHNGMLWCGTNPAGDGADGGKVYYFRPEVDTVWTEDEDMDTHSVGGVTGLVSYQGKLVATTVTNSGTSAKVVSRAIDGTWSTVATGSGTAALNAYLSPVVYNDVLYFAYFDSTFGSRIYSYDGTTVTSVLTSTYDDHAFIGLYLASGNIYALGGGFELDAILYGSEDGTTWDDLTDFLPGQATQKATPVFAEVRTA